MFYLLKGDYKVLMIAVYVSVTFFESEQFSFSVLREGVFAVPFGSEEPLAFAAADDEAP